MKKRLIAVIGRKASGKDTAGAYLKDSLSSGYFQCSEWLRLYAKENDILYTLLGEVSEKLETESGKDFFLSEVLKLPEPIIVITGLRDIATLKKIKELGGVVVFMEITDESIRESRVMSRNRDNDQRWIKNWDRNHVPYRELHGGATWEEMKAIADIVVNNDGTLEELHTKLEKLIVSLHHQDF